MKMDLDRRSFLLGSTSALSLSVLPLKLLATASASKAVPPAPVARVTAPATCAGGTILSSRPRDFAPAVQLARAARSS